MLAADADLAPLQHALRLLASLLPSVAAPCSSGSTAQPAASSSRSSSSVQQSQAAAVPQQQQQQQPPPRQQQQRQREWDPPRERNTAVLLPTSVERDVPDWFFQRTGIELKGAFLSAARRREQDQVGVGARVAAGSLALAALRVRDACMRDLAPLILCHQVPLLWHDRC